MLYPHATSTTVDDPLKGLEGCGNGIFLIMGNAGFISSTVGLYYTALNEAALFKKGSYGGFVHGLCRGPVFRPSRDQGLGFWV